MEFPPKREKRRLAPALFSHLISAALHHYRGLMQLYELRIQIKFALHNKQAKLLLFFLFLLGNNTAFLIPKTL